MDWNDPAQRSSLIWRVGPEEYTRLQQLEFERNTVATENGYKIRRVVSGRFGTIYMVDGLNRGHQTLEGARQLARTAAGPS